VQRNVVVHRIALTLVVLLLLFAGASWAQTVTVARNANLRTEQSTAEPPLTVLEPLLQDGYYHVRTSAGEKV
jgi:hypothetical protein